MEKVGLNITQKEFKQLSKWAENVYNTIVVIDYFVASQPEIEEWLQPCSGCKSFKKQCGFIECVLHWAQRRT